MTDIADTANLEAEQVQEIAKPLTLAEARAARMSKIEQSSATEIEETEAKPDAPEVPEESTEAEEPESEEVEDVLSQVDEIDVDSLSDDDIYALAKLKGIDIENPKSSKAWAEQRKEIKALKEQIETAQREKEEALALAPVSDSPFANLRDPESVDKAIEQAELNAEYWNEQLILNQETQWDEDSGKDIKGVMHEGKFHTAAAILHFVKGERAKVKPLAERKAEIAKQSEFFANEGDKVASIKSELALDGEVGESYEAMLKSPKFALVKSLIPEYGMELLELLGHAARSKAGVTSKPTIKRKAPKSKDENISIGSTGRTSANESGREAALNKIVNGNGYNYKQKMDAMRELRILRNK